MKNTTMTTMHSLRLLLSGAMAALLLAAAGGAHAQAYVNATVGGELAPGVYGRINIGAITNLEKSLAANKPKALIQMATGSGKTFTSIGFIYRLIKFGGARRVLFLVDRGNLARQTKKEFDAYASPYNNYKFGEEYIVQHLQGGHMDKSARMVNLQRAQALRQATLQRAFALN
jgi:hypothetical protein